MASGLPDYQRLVRERYGGATVSQGSAVANALTTKTLVTVSGKGMIYGGYVVLDHSSSQKDSAVRLILDGSEHVATTFADMNKYGLVKDRTLPMVMSVFDDTEFIYGVSLTYGVTFESELKVVYNESHDSTPTVIYQVIYALI